MKTNKTTKQFKAEKLISSNVNIFEGKISFENFQLGKNLREWREEARLTQLKLSHLTGISQSLLSRWEAGENLPSIRDLITLADFYHISLDELVGRDL